MADEGLSVRATNGPAFDAALDSMARDMADLQGPLAAAARELAAKASAAAPRRSGRLASSHRVIPAGPRRVRVDADTPYAAVIHWGWPAHGIKRQPWLVATWLKDGGPLEAAANAIQADIDKAAART